MALAETNRPLGGRSVGPQSFTQIAPATAAGEGGAAGVCQPQCLLPALRRVPPIRTR